MDGKKRLLRNDLLLIAGVLLVAGVILAILFFTRTAGAYAVVTVDGKETARYLLSTDIETRIETGYGYNMLVIRDGKVSVTEADCDNQVCVHTHTVQYDGETIVCLPHKLVVRIENGKNTGTR